MAIKSKIKTVLDKTLKDRPKFRPAKAGYLASGRPFKCGGKIKKQKTC